MINELFLAFDNIFGNLIILIVAIFILITLIKSILWIILK